MTSPIDYLVSKGFRITSNPNEYYESYNPNQGKKDWGQRDLWEWHNGRKIWHDSYCDGKHPAYDLSIKEGANIPAVVDGYIADGTRQNGNFGGTVVLCDHKGDWQYIMGHCKNIQVKVGDHVKQGQKLAEQSSTNYYNNPMNSHLHFQTQKQKYYAQEKAFVCTGVQPEKIDVNDYVGDPFLEKIKPYAIADYKESNILPSITGAQAVLESARGESELAKNSNNLFGIKGEYKGQSYTINTKEYLNGKWTTVDAAFKKYPSFKESITDHGKFFTSTPWRTKNYKTVTSAKDYVTQAEALQSASYATDPAYASKLIDIIKREGLAAWDEEATGKKVPSSPSKPASKPSTPTSKGSYTVKKGDTLYSISKKYNTSVDKLKQLNNLTSNLLSIGQKLQVSKTGGSSSTHKVVKGDTLWSLSKEYNTTVAKLKSINGLKNDVLSIGQVLKVGESSDKAKPAKFNPKQNHPLSDNAYATGKIDKLEAEVRKYKNGNFNTKAGYDLKAGDTIYIFESKNGWLRIYTSRTSGKGSNEFVWHERVKINKTFK